MNKCRKKLIALLFAVLVCVSIGTTPVYAVNQRFGSWIASALMALNMGLSEPLNSLTDVTQYLSDPFDVVYTYTEQNIDQYFDKSEIYIRPGVTTIDGVEYSDVWLSHDAAEKFRVNALDFITAKNIVSESSGTYASGAGFVDGIPVYLVDGQYRTPMFSVPFGESGQIGSYTVGTEIIATVGNHTSCRTFSSNGQSQSIVYYDYYPYYGSAFGSYYNLGNPSNPSQSGVLNFGQRVGNSTISPSITAAYSVPFISSPFDFDYVSGVIPADPIPNDEGLLIRTPTTNVQNFINVYPQVTQVVENDDGTASHGVTINIDGGDVELVNNLGDLIPVILPWLINGSPSDPNNTVQFAPVPTGEDPVPPVSDTTISNTPYQDLRDDLNRIIQSIDNFRESMQSRIDIFKEAMQLRLDTIQALIEAFMLSFQNHIFELMDQFNDWIEELGESIKQIPENLEKHTIDTYKKGLSGLKNIFAPLLLLLRGFLGIWHYVVEWLASIAAPFQLFFGFLSGMSYNAVLPIYASIAGVIVIAVYKRFGR